ncbi:MAG: hypothetical protein BAA04_10070 [Firmicutes bacterium ZCTH02-B6]|nr:MAG: hypothetical protein BAA04_10070 [Firmicutes bacterium ZCTH02-B6]
MGACRKRRRLIVPVSQTVNTAQNHDVNINVDVTLILVLIVVVVVVLNNSLTNGAVPLALRALLPMLENDPRFRQLASSLRSMLEPDQNQGQEQPA